MLELAILGLLKERPMHGYELRKQLSSRLGFFWSVSFGSLYPTLRRLERNGYVERSRPETKRRRQVFRLTDSGADHFLALLEGSASSAWEEEKFPLRLAFFRHLAPDGRVRLLERRKVYLAGRLDEARAYEGATTGDRWLRSLARHGVATTEADLAWIDELIAAERRAVDGLEPTAEPPTDTPSTIPRTVPNPPDEPAPAARMNEEPR